MQNSMNDSRYFTHTRENLRQPWGNLVYSEPKTVYSLKKLWRGIIRRVDFKLGRSCLSSQLEAGREGKGTKNAVASVTLFTQVTHYTLGMLSRMHCNYSVSCNKQTSMLFRKSATFILLECIALASASACITNMSLFCVGKMNKLYSDPCADTCSGYVNCWDSVGVSGMWVAGTVS